MHDDATHEAGVTIVVSTFALRQALAWSVGAEHVRRHPNSIRLMKVFPHQYGPALTLWEKRAALPPPTSRSARRDDALAPGRGLAFLTLGESFHIQPLVEPALGVVGIRWTFFSPRTVGTPSSSGSRPSPGFPNGINPHRTRAAWSAGDRSAS